MKLLTRNFSSKVKASSKEMLLRDFIGDRLYGIEDKKLGLPGGYFT